MIKFTHKGKTYEFNEQRMSGPEAIVVKKHTGLGVIELVQALAKGDPDAMVALLMLAKLRSGQLKHGRVIWDQIVADFDDDNDLFKMLGSIEFEDNDEPAAEAPADEEKKPAKAAKPAA